MFGAAARRPLRCGLRWPACRGISLIEVLAAMVILSSGAVILFGWIAQTADRLGAMSREQQSLFSELTGIEYLRSVNPMRDPAGQARIGDVTVRWSATPEGEESQVRAGGSVGLYVVRLYKVEMRTGTAERDEESVRNLYLAGWRMLSTAPRTAEQALGAVAPPAARPTTPNAPPPR